MKQNIINPKTVMQCPNFCKDSTFLTTAHIMQEWEVDENGTFLAMADEYMETTHGPDRGNIWGCTKCGAIEREVVIDT